MHKVNLFHAIIALLVFSSCSSEKTKETEQFLIGSWEMSAPDEEVTYTFNADGTYSYYDNRTGMNLHCAGKYEVQSTEGQPLAQLSMELNDTCHYNCTTQLTWGIEPEPDGKLTLVDSIGTGFMSETNEAIKFTFIRKQ